MEAQEVAHLERAIATHVASTCLVDADEASIDHDHDLLTSGIIDSMGVMELVGFVEGTFGIAVDDQDILPENFRSVSAIAQYVARKQAGGAGDAWQNEVANFLRFVGDSLDSNAIVLVANHGDDALLRFSSQTGWHFPRDKAGRYAGYNPTDDAEAIAQIEAQRAVGATHIAFPTSEAWWLDHYAGLQAHLESAHGEVARSDGAVIFALAR